MQVGTDEDRRGLVMVSEPRLLEGIMRLAAAAGFELQHVVDTTQARRRWRSAPIVLLDTPAALECARAALPRRDGVLVTYGGDQPVDVWRGAAEIGAEHVLELPTAESWLVTALAEAAEGTFGGGAALSVVGGRGGAGASVLAAAVAVTAVRDGTRSLLVDCDPLGGGLDLVLGAEDLGGLRWPDIDVRGGRVPATALHAALPAPPVRGKASGASPDRGEASLGVLSCARTDFDLTPEALASIISSGRRAGETVVCDLPRYPTEAAIAALGASDLTVLLVPADVRSCAAAAQVASVLVELSPRVGLVVRGPSPGGIDAAEASRAIGLPLLAAMRPEPRIEQALERGETPIRPRGPLAVAARKILDVLPAPHGWAAAS
ncbi:septum site-determining protein Ssd [Pseudonocardia sp. TRM90224]|uniref:septum site-determining protein Ssd n=1 Tax=Pseudonocardia sp. TRM90224 TaxID=2812678 RepID=UPI001E37567C|nr:septum site-determining protein Ssd [Pseudonocardia sp. TRM90224]